MSIQLNTEGGVVDDAVVCLGDVLGVYVHEVVGACVVAVVEICAVPVLGIVGVAIGSRRQQGLQSI